MKHSCCIILIFILDENATSEERISTLYQCIDGVRKAYVDAKAKLAKLDKKSRKFKRLQKKEKAKNILDKQINTNLESNLNSVTEISSEDGNILSFIKILQNQIMNICLKLRKYFCFQSVSLLATMMT